MAYPTTTTTQQGGCRWSPQRPGVAKDLWLPAAVAGRPSSKAGE